MPSLVVNQEKSVIPPKEFVLTLSEAEAELICWICGGFNAHIGSTDRENFFMLGEIYRVLEPEMPTNSVERYLSSEADRNLEWVKAPKKAPKSTTTVIGNAR